jgi:hypothetical protein
MSAAQLPSILSGVILVIERQLSTANCQRTTVNYQLFPEFPCQTSRSPVRTRVAGRANAGGRPGERAAAGGVGRGARIPGRAKSRRGR